MNNEQHEMLYGQTDPTPAPHVRIQQDLVASLVAVLNVYGDMWRPPTYLLTWPKEEIMPLYAVFQNADNELGRAAGAEDQPEMYWGHLASAIGYYQDALTKCRSLGRKLEHEPLENYARAAHRYVKGTKNAKLFSLVAKGESDEMKDRIADACKRTRQRFGEQLRKHAVAFDPPVVAEQFVYTTGGDDEPGKDDHGTD